MAKYIYQYPNWPEFSWDEQLISSLFGEVRNLQGQLAGQMKALGFSNDEAKLQTLTLDVVTSSEIEGELLNYEQVRSSIARRLGINVAGLLPPQRSVEGIVEMMLDATQNSKAPLTENRLFGWHAALFPTGYSSMYKIVVGNYRTVEMEIVSGPMGREKVHFVAVPAKNVKAEMDKFLSWANDMDGMDPVLKAAIAHFWFIIIHPFDDGNGRIARAISDYFLGKAEGEKDRFYSMSNRILEEKKEYYAMLQKEQHSKGDITSWILWFFRCIKNALKDTETRMENILQKSRFWTNHEYTPLNERQRLMLNMQWDGFDGKLKSSKWAKIAKCSPDTALRDIKDLIEKGILVADDESGRSTSYSLAPF